jgi:hypothetical protein
MRGQQEVEGAMRGLHPVTGGAAAEQGRQRRSYGSGVRGRHEHAHHLRMVLAPLAGVPVTLPRRAGVDNQQTSALHKHHLPLQLMPS